MIKTNYTDEEIKNLLALGLNDDELNFEILNELKNGVEKEHEKLVEQHKIESIRRDILDKSKKLLEGRGNYKKNLFVEELRSISINIKTTNLKIQSLSTDMDNCLTVIKEIKSELLKCKCKNKKINVI
ncbi:hypothetical protein [Clostridium scatologenes]|uniref:Uncharacterized protein n=1 Tax=Clostridium scatologenes TaxID=1548 RepID=A0A0E3K3F7_CLOSL|nr:hypothetical protein [Clostridium scatologenes]AKA71212.1 hypothetical protein CSCA_4087 [Clostridium scatologenes]